MTQVEYRALVEAADRTLRTPEAQARYILRRELERLGLLSEATTQEEASHEQES